MIGLVGVLAPHRHPPWVVQLDGIPRTPAAGLSGVVVRCEDEAEARATVEWYAGIRARRPGFGLGLISRPEHCVDAVRPLRFPIKVFLSPDRLEQGRLPIEVIEEIAEVSVEGRILEEIIDECEGMPTQVLTLGHLITHGSEVGRSPGRPRMRGSRKIHPAPVWLFSAFIRKADEADPVPRL